MSAPRSPSDDPHGFRVIPGGKTADAPSEHVRTLLDHEHRFESYGPADTEPPTGSWGQRFCRCECGLGLRRRYRDGILVELRVQKGPAGLWFDPLEVVRVTVTSSTTPGVNITPLVKAPAGLVVMPFMTCPRCEGQKHDRGSCGVCGNLGVLDGRAERFI